VYLAVNETFGRLTGLHDVVGRKVTEIIPAVREETPELFEVYGRVARGGEPERFEIDFTPLSKWLEIAVFCPAEGHFVAVFDDVTERKRNVQALLQSEERYRALAEENERLYRQQLTIAENLQLALLNIPEEIGRVRLGHLYRSATEAAKVGGDFYDVFEVRDGKVAVLIGDVSGHGIEGARVATLTKDVIHAFAHQTLRPQEALKRTNRLLREKSLPGFVTVFLGVLDPDSGILHFASAGHPETLLRRTGGQIEVLGDGSLPLGVLDEASWKMGQTQLEPGDLVLLYTDGVIEARRDGQFFGQEGLTALLRRKRVSTKSLPQLIVNKVLAFSGGVLRDDLAILALSLSGDMPESALESDRPEAGGPGAAVTP
jgi:serine phosphatase RsbU (regulator of sigma subunit)